MDYPPIQKMAFLHIFAFSFCNLLFAIIPETYAISGFLISLLILYYQKCDSVGSCGNLTRWFLLAVLLAGITLTNVCLFCIVYTARRSGNSGRSFLKAAFRAALVSVAAVAVVFFVYQMTHFILRFPPWVRMGIAYVQEYSAFRLPNVLRNGLAFGVSSMQAFFPAGVLENSFDFIAADGLDSLCFYKSRNDAASWIIAGLVFAIVITALRKCRNSEYRRLLRQVLLPMVAFNFVLHLVFGREIFLYSKHWIVPLTLLLFPLVARKTGLPLLALTGLLAINFPFILIRVHELILY
ncbi:MAG: hypothetical protein HN368_00965, partial [Spirochaetales bacterium]|nr:hypothetical protein [Spirochaetales bacterium]